MLSVLPKSVFLLSGGHFVFCNFEGQKLEVQLGIRQIWIQHTQIVVKMVDANFYPKMPLELYLSTFSRFST